MSKAPAEPVNIVLEQLRLMRAEANELRAEMNTRFDKVEAHLDEEIASLKKELRGIKLNTIAEIYKANLTVASFADHERRIAALEGKRS